MWVESKKWKLVFPDHISNKTGWKFNRFWVQSQLWSLGISNTKLQNLISVPFILINGDWLELIAITKIYNLTAILRSCVPPFIQLHDASIFKLRSPCFQGKIIALRVMWFSQVSRISSKLNFKKIRWLEIVKLQKQKRFQCFKLIRSDFTFFSVDECRISQLAVE